MSKQYYVWKNLACGGIHVEWQKLTGREFYAMVKRQENRQRRFIRLTNDICEDADIIVIEATELQYQQWRKEQNAHNYLARQEAGCIFCRWTLRKINASVARSTMP